MFWTPELPMRTLGLRGFTTGIAEYPLPGIRVELHNETKAFQRYTVYINCRKMTFVGSVCSYSTSYILFLEYLLTYL